MLAARVRSAGANCARVACSGVGLTEKNSDGKTALEVAQMNEQHEIAEMLQAKEGEAFL